MTEGRQNIGALAGGGNPDGHVTRPPQRLDLAREDVFESQIVSRRGESRAVGRQRDGRNGFTVLAVAYGKFGREMLCVGGASAIAEEQDLSALPDRAHPNAQHGFEIASQSFMSRTPFI